MDVGDFANRLWSRVKRGTTKECWEWTGYRTKPGYGMLSIRALSKMPLYAHRLAWELTHGPIPEGLHVLHQCDNPPCCNPDHFFLGTQRDNNFDRDRKGRVASGDRNGSRTRPDRRAVGERCGSSKMTESKVRKLRRAWARGDATQRELAKRFDISQQQVSTIVSRQHWRHVGEDE